MNRLNLKKSAVSIIIISIFCLLSVLLLIVKKNNISDMFSANASLIDQNLASGFYNQTVKQLSDLYTGIDSSSSALRFLKRSDKVAEATGDYSKFSNYAADLHTRYKNNLEIAAVYAYAEYMNGNYEKSFQVSETKLSKSDYNFIYLASSLKLNGKILDSKAFEKIPPSYRLFFKNEEIGPEELIEASKLIKDDRLLIDAALLLMVRGEKLEAADIIDELEKPDNTAAMFIAYDNKNFSSAGRYYADIAGKNEMSTEIEMFGADIYLENSNYDASALIYDRIIKEQSGYSWIPYRNLYSLKAGSEAALSYLKDGLILFPDQQELLLPLAWETYLRTGSKESAELNSLSNADTNEPMSELFRINVLLKNRSPEHIIGNYWNIINKAPDSEIIAVSFANYLLRNRSFQQLELLLKRYTEHNGESAWMLMYSAVSEMMQGNVVAAGEYINKSVEIEETTASLYNKGVISLISGNSTEAEFWLKKALDKEEINNSTQYLPKIYYKLAENYYNNLEYNEAERFVKYALRIDPDDMRSSLLLNKIKEGYNDKTKKQ